MDATMALFSHVPLTRGEVSAGARKCNIAGPKRLRMATRPEYSGLFECDEKGDKAHAAHHSTSHIGPVCVRRDATSSAILVQKHMVRFFVGA